MGRGWNRWILVAAGLTGAVGVMAAAASSHAGESRNLGAIAAIGLAHGPALLALALAGRGRLLGGAAIALAIGTLVFVADLGMREWQGYGLFAGAAPLGGAGMIGGWAVLVIAGLIWKRDHDPKN